MPREARIAHRRNQRHHRHCLQPNWMEPGPHAFPSLPHEWSLCAQMGQVHTRSSRATPAPTQVRSDKPHWRGSPPTHLCGSKSHAMRPSYCILDLDCVSRTFIYLCTSEKLTPWPTLRKDGCSQLLSRRPDARVPFEWHLDEWLTEWEPIYVKLEGCGIT